MLSANDNSEIEIDESYIKLGECRCCLAKGEHRDVTKEYYYNNIKEVYKDIFLECFNLTLSPHNLLSCLICDKCIDRLRDATSFRMMVVATEDQLLRAVVFKSDPDTEFVEGPKNFNTEVKIECETDNIETESAEVFDDFDFDDENSKDSKESADVFDDFDFIDESSKDSAKDSKESADVFDDLDFEYESSKDSSFEDEGVLVIDEGRDDESIEYETDFDECASFCSSITLNSTSSVDDEPCELIDGETKFLARFPKPVRPLPKQRNLSQICPEYNEHVNKIYAKLVRPKSLEWFCKGPDMEEKLVSNKLALALNATTIFEYSNATAFRTKTRHGYACYYCREVFKYDKLKEHQETHEKASIYKMLLKYNADEFVIYADITDLKCKICRKRIKDLKVLMTHLSRYHAKKIYTSADRVIPFKLKDSNLNCQLCEEKFETFAKVEKHMNIHFSNFMCNTCEIGFITKHRLAVHNYSQHKGERVICNVCRKSFRSQIKYRQHYEGVHENLRKFQCAKCPEKFIDYFTRHQHMVDVHSEAPLLYKCDVCEKAFKRRFALSTHVKRCHVAVRNVTCDKCTYKCFTNSELKDHKIKHGGTEPFECTICNKKYSRNRSLVAHLKTHKPDENANGQNIAMTKK